MTGQNPDAAHLAIMSPSELLRVICNETLDSVIVPFGAIVGPAPDAAQKGGVLSITDAGNTQVDREAPAVWKRLQIRVLHTELARTERIGQHAFDILHRRHRELIDDSTAHTWLVHRVMVTAGPSIHYDGISTWEGLMFVEMLIGTVPVT